MATESGHGSLRELRAQIEHAAGQRAELLRVLSESHDREVVSACAGLDRRLAGLWEAHRLLRARLRYGEPAEIKQRARHEERVLRSA
jgi:hypothetical protein